MGARVGGLRARLVWEGAARGALAACAAERRALCAAGQRGGGVGAHARRINTACPRRSSSRNAVSVTEDEFSTINVIEDCSLGGASLLSRSGWIGRGDF